MEVPPVEIIIENEVIQMEQPSAAKVLKYIETSGDAQHFLSHLIADGKEVYENFEAYLTQHVDEIKKLTVVTQTIEKFVNSSLKLARDYLVKAIPTLSSLSDSFYQAPSSTDWQTLANLFAGISWLDKMTHTIESTKSLPEKWSAFKMALEHVHEQLAEMEAAMQSKDQILIADLLQYEFLPLFMQMAETLKASRTEEQDI